ncbi:MAG: HAMP domain-containing protein [Planctomycetes bacterium]|nr:HAMP domain-containing protein [Planctomycetota bacterium]
MSPETSSIKKRLQHVSLHTKIIVPMVALAIVPVMIVGGFSITRMRGVLQELVVQRVVFDTESKAQQLQAYLQSIRQDLRFLSQLDIVRELADAAANTGAAPAALRANVERQLVIFSQGKRAYYQVRYLTDAGREVVRLDVDGGAPRVVAEPNLQNKGPRYYVQQLLATEPGEIYVSPMDLNIEHGQVEVPHRGVVRLGIRVAGTDGQWRGMLVVNVFADYILSLIGPLPGSIEAWLLDEEGAYLGGVKTDDPRLSLETRRSLSADYAPPEVALILGAQHQAQTIRTQLSIVTAASLTVDPREPQQRWILLMLRPRHLLEAPIRFLTVTLGVVIGLVTVTASVVGLFVGWYVVRPITALRRTTRQIAEGDLSRRVHIETGDEIESLADDFNRMAKHLCESRDHLAAWNDKLAQEVTRQTEHLRRLQSGLAQSDKLASIGQMTAGIMHEIGNPLAAIKTKIQVAEWAGELPEAQRELVHEVLEEVNRLTLFLRSFSRLGRLSEPRMASVGLAEVVQGVITLVEPELRCRGIDIHVEQPPQAVWLHCDANQLRQVVINLVLNAADAMSGGGSVLVRMRRARTPTDTAPGIVIEVVDHGPGIDPQVVEQIWDPFFTTKPDGTGLGLATCRRIVEDHRGTIQVHSTPGQGTIFVVHLPGAVEQTDDQARDGSDA